MSKLNIDQNTIKELFENKKSVFLIPDYQRPYAWEEKECQTLWDDIFTFAIPDEDAWKFDSDSEYFLGPIVTFENENGKKEIIDGQQRLTTLMLLLRAFYEEFGHMKDENSLELLRDIEKCIWEKDEAQLGKVNKNKLKIDSEVASDNDKGEFLEILLQGRAESHKKSRYAVNYRFFQKCIADFKNNYPTFFAYLPYRIMNNCILLPIEAESLVTALRIFSTLNDRGKPLSDSDIFKAQFYKFYSNLGRKDEFIGRWKSLEEICEKIFHPITGTPMDELFTRYMYYVRAKKGIKSSTTEALRKFYERDGYALLRDESTFNDLELLAQFWEDVSNQDKDLFSTSILKRLFVLNYAPNSMWTYFVTVYFMHHKDEKNLLDEDSFFAFLNKIIGFIWTYAVTHSGINSLRTPVYAEMVNIVNDQPVTFAGYKFEEERIRNMFSNFSFTNSRAITKSMITWWTFQNTEQELLSLETTFEIEHIYAKNRQGKENSLKNPRNLEKLGNKALLEKRINIRAADYRFSDKIKYYQGYKNIRGQMKEGTRIQELKELSNTMTNFIEADILSRDHQIMDAFIKFLYDNDLMQTEW